MVLFVLSQGFLSLALWPSFFDLSLLCKISKTGEPPPHPLISSQLRPNDYPRTGCTAAKNIFCSDCPQVISVQPKANAIRNCCTDLSRPRTCQWRMPFVTPSAVQQEIFVSENLVKRAAAKSRGLAQKIEHCSIGANWYDLMRRVLRSTARHGAAWCEVVHVRRVYCKHASVYCKPALMASVRIRPSSHDFGWQSSHSVNLAGWQAKMASIEI